MRTIGVLCLVACSGARPASKAPGLPPCDALPLLGKVEPAALASDGEGGLAVAGRFEGPMRAAGFTAAAAGGSDVFVLRTNADGSVRWLRRIGGPGNESASAVAVMPNGDAVVAGAAGERCFVARLAEADGREVWTSRLPGGESNCRALSVDARGDVWATGYFSGSLSGNMSKGLYDLFVVKFSGASGD